MTINQTHDNPLIVAGDDYARGRTQGEAFRERLNALFHSIRRINIFPGGLQRAVPLSVYRFGFGLAGKNYLKRHEPFLNSPRGAGFKRRIEGLADGLGVSVHLAYGINALESIASEMPHVPQPGCTSLALPAERTLERTPVIAYNHDFPVSFGEHLLMRRNEPTGGLRSLCLTYPILVGCIAGINEAGLGVTINHAFEKKVNKDRAALFVTWLLQDCLDTCRDVESAVRLILATPVTNGSMITLIDASGNRAVVEVSSHGNARRDPEDFACVTFNKYRVPDLEKVELPIDTVGAKMLKGRLVHAANLGRTRRFAGLFDQGKSYSDEDIRAMLSDHDGAGGAIDTICRHDGATADTLASAILKPALGVMKVIYGLPCQGAYREYRLVG